MRYLRSSSSCVLAAMIVSASEAGAPAKILRRVPFERCRPLGTTATKRYETRARAAPKLLD